MLKFTIKSQKIAGIAAESVKPNEKKKFKIWTKIPSITSDEKLFYKIITEMGNIFLNKIPFSPDLVSRFLILLHDNDIADIYVNDFPEMQKIKVNKSIEKGEPVYRKDITDIKEVKFPGIKIRKTDVVIYCTRINWRFGLYLDFTRKIDIEKMHKELGDVVRTLSFKKFLTEADLSLDKAKKEKNVDTWIVTEGKTDWRHLKAARKKLKIKSKLAFYEFEEGGGDINILKMCKEFAKLPNQTKRIFVFDNDNERILKELDKKTKGNANYQSWGNNVFSFYLPKPSHRKKYKNISIEFFYTDDEIHAIDPKTKKQLLFTNEIEERVIKNITSKKHQISFVKLDEPIREDEFDKKIYCEDVPNIVGKNGKQVAHSKTIFANNVINEKHGYNNFNFSEFKEIFKIINMIRKRK